MRRHVRASRPESRDTFMIELVLLDQTIPAVPSPVQTDLRSLYAQGVEARFAGRFDEALGMFEALLATNPEDVDSRLNAALCLIALERLDEAESELEHVIDQAPDYVDAYTALARVRRMKGDAQGSHEFIDAAETLSSDHADYAAMREQASRQDRNRITTNLTASRSSLTKDLPDWTSLSPAVAVRVSDTLTLSASALYAERFDRSNTNVHIGAAKRTGFGHVRMEIGGGTNTTFLPNTTVLVGAGVATHYPGLELLSDIRTSEYQSGRVTSFLPGAQYTFAGEAAEIEVRYINVRDENDQHRSGYRMRSTFRPTGPWAVHLYYADAPESSDGATVEVQSYAAGLEMRFGRTTALRLTAGKELRTAYDRTDISLSLARSF